MTPRKKAKELVDKMYQHQWRKDTIEFRNAKQCALIAVDEMLNDENEFIQTIPHHLYWERVKKEIEKL